MKAEGQRHLERTQRNKISSLFKLYGKLNGRDCVFLVDCGATSNFISMTFAKRHKLLTDVECGSVSFGDGRTADCKSRLTRGVNVRIGPHRERMEFVAVTLDRGYDAILGMP